MHKELERLAGALCRPAPLPDVPAESLRELAARATVALPAGGFGYRMRAVSEGAGTITQKALLPLPGGETLISRLVHQYADAGFRRFVALVNYEGRAVEEHLGDGRRWGVEIRYSYDPDRTGSGRTGAIVYAIHAGILPAEEPVVVHNADCQIMHYPGCFPHDLLRAHRHAVAARNAVATLAAVDGTPYPYTGMSIEDGMVTDVEMYPFVPVPTHTGITLLTPEALEQLQASHVQTRQNFERDMFPRWSAEGRLAAMVLSHRHWIAVDDRKAYLQFCQAVEEELRAASAAG